MQRPLGFAMSVVCAAVVGVSSGATPSRVQLLKQQPAPLSTCATLIQEVPGWEGLELSEYKELVDYFWGISQCQHVVLIAPDKTFAVLRDRCNDRGDEGTEMRRQISIETIGYRIEVGRQPFLIQSNKGDGHWDAAHCAGIISGIRRAWAADTTKANKNVQSSIRAGLPNCHTYMRTIPDFARTFLKDLGNLTNSQVTETTMLEKYRLVPRIDNAFTRKKNAMTWTMKSCGGAAGLEDKKWEYVNQLYEGFWSNKTSFSHCHHFFIESKKIDTVAWDSGAAESVWDTFARRVNGEVDLMHGVSTNHDRIFKIARSVFSKLKGTHPQFITPVILMYLPRVPPPAVPALGVCSLVPSGCPLIAVSKFDENAVQELVLEMEGPQY